MRIASTVAREELADVRRRAFGSTELSHRKVVERLGTSPDLRAWQLFEGHLYDLAFMLDEHLTFAERAATRGVMLDIYPSFSINGITYNSRQYGPIIGVSSAVFWMMLFDSLVLMSYETTTQNFSESISWAKEVMRLARYLQCPTLEWKPRWPTLSDDLQSRLPGLFQHQFLFIVAHELGHIIHAHHLAPDSYVFPWRNELDADAFGADLLLRLRNDRPGVQGTLDAVFVKLRALDAAAVGFDRIRAAGDTHPPPGIRRLSLAYRKQLSPVAYHALVELLTLSDLRDELD